MDEITRKREEWTRVMLRAMDDHDGFSMIAQALFPTDPQRAIYAMLAAVCVETFAGSLPEDREKQKAAIVVAINGFEDAIGRASDERRAREEKPRHLVRVK